MLLLTQFKQSTYSQIILIFNKTPFLNYNTKNILTLIYLFFGIIFSTMFIILKNPNF